METMEEPQQFAESEERGLLPTRGFSNIIFSNPKRRNVFFINISPLNYSTALAQDICFHWLHGVVRIKLGVMKVMSSRVFGFIVIKSLLFYYTLSDKMIQDGVTLI